MFDFSWVFPTIVTRQFPDEPDRMTEYYMRLPGGHWVEVWDDERFAEMCGVSQSQLQDIIKPTPTGTAAKHD